MMNRSAEIFSKGSVGFEKALLGLDQATKGKVIESTSGESSTISWRKISADGFITDGPYSDERYWLRLFHLVCTTLLYGAMNTKTI